MNPFQIDKCFILSLDKREALWVALRKECEARGFDTDNFVVGDGRLIADSYQYDFVDEPAAAGKGDNWAYGSHWTKINHYNCFKSYKTLLQRAKEAKHKRVLILEDDAYFVSRFDEVVGILQDELMSLDFDILFLGWWQYQMKDDMHARENLLYEQYWQNHRFCGIKRVSPRGAGGFHGVVINNSLYDLLLGFNDIAPLDCQLNMHGHENLKSFFIYPKILHVHSMLSNCDGRYITRDVL